MAEIEKPQISYYGQGVDKLLSSGIKIVTLRKPHEKYDITPGTVVEAVCEGADNSIPLMVIDNSTRPLNDFSDPSLLLDGYANPEVAAEDLANYYEGVDVDTQMQRIATISESQIELLGNAQLEWLLGIGLDAALKEPSFRPIFMPALFHWFRTYGNATVKMWHKWLVKQGLITDKEISAKMELDENTRYFYNMLYRGLVPKELSIPSSLEYQSVVLHQRIKIPIL